MFVSGCEGRIVRRAAYHCHGEMLRRSEAIQLQRVYGRFFGVNLSEEWVRWRREDCYLGIEVVGVWPPNI